MQLLEVLTSTVCCYRGNPPSYNLRYFQPSSVLGSLGALLWEKTSKMGTLHCLTSFVLLDACAYISLRPPLDPIKSS